MNDKLKKLGVSISRRGFQHWSSIWSQDCPEGTWTGRLDKKRWAKSPEMALYFTDTATQERYWFFGIRLRQRPTTRWLA
jgi:hypothetical protein